MASIPLEGVMETALIVGAVFCIVTLASTEAPEPRASSGVTRTDHVSCFAVSADGRRAELCAVCGVPFLLQR